MIDQPAIQLVAIEPDYLVNRRVEQEPWLVLDMDLERELARALQREKRFAHRVLGAEERQHRAPL